MNLWVDEKDEDNDTNLKTSTEETTTSGVNNEENNNHHEENSLSTSSPLSPKTINSKSSSSSNTVQVVHFNPQEGNFSTIETTRAPTKRWQRSAKFLGDGENSSLVSGRYNLSSSSSSNLTSDISQETSFISQTFKYLSDIYSAPLVEFVVDASSSKKNDGNDSNNGGEKEKEKTQHTSLTVRMLSRLSSWMFGERSWVEKGRREKNSSNNIVVTSDINNSSNKEPKAV